MDTLQDTSRDDFSSMGVDLFRKLNIKVAIILFIVGIFVFSGVFTEGVLRNITGAMEGMEPTQKGIIIQLATLCILYIFIDAMVQSGTI